MSQKIDELEKASLAAKSWQLSGEVTAQSRPENSMLEEDLDFEQASRKAAVPKKESCGLGFLKCPLYLCF